MIKREEIEEKSKEFEIHPSNVQRDYVFSWLLTGIYTKSELRDHLVLKGGNCLRKAYFENTRFSGDLDFSAASYIDEEFLGRELNKVCDFVQEISGIQFEKEKTLVQEKRRVDTALKVLDVRLYFNDFYGKKNNILISVRFDVTQFDKLYLPTQKRFLIHPYSDFQSCRSEVICVKLEEVLASKLKCLLQRRHSSDFYDYAFALVFNKFIDINRVELVNTFLKMTIFGRSPGIVKDLLIDLPFIMLKSLWEKFLIYPKQGLINFESAVLRFQENISELFGQLHIGNGFYDFFPSKFRNPIMEAGHDMTLLKICYDGKTRLVEPYSLAYKHRKDGVAKEYLYVYDLNGGWDSGPGIKTFLHTKIQSIENTNTKFEPKFEVELKKAGEQLKTSYFGNPFSFTRTKRQKYTSLKSKTRLRYIFQCTFCNKKFVRQTRNSKLNPHKDKYGNNCFGRHSIYIGMKN